MGCVHVKVFWELFPICNYGGENYGKEIWREEEESMNKLGRNGERIEKGALQYLTEGERGRMNSSCSELGRITCDGFFLFEN